VVAPSAALGDKLAAMRLPFVALLGAAACAGRPTQNHHDHGPLVHRFEHAEEWAKKFDDPERDAWQRPDDVVEALRLSPGMTVADLGAGTGYFAARLSRAVGEGGKVLALDVEPDMVRYLEERVAREKLTNVEPRLAAYDDPKLARESVDRVLVVDVWHHVGGREAYAAKLKAALRPGGSVLIVDFKKESKHGPPPHHRLAPEQILRELGAGGLTASVAPTALPDQYVVVGAR